MPAKLWRGQKGQTALFPCLAARRIRTEPWGNNITLIALTGGGQPEDKRRTPDAGFDHHLVKPPDPQVQRQLLRRG
ncbi:MAG: hypothetical protein AB7O38_30975 [Pirellulaceae bacterium]